MEDKIPYPYQFRTPNRSARSVVAIPTTVYNNCIKGICFMIHWQKTYGGTCCCNRSGTSHGLQFPPEFYIRLIVHIMTSDPQQTVS